MRVSIAIKVFSSDQGLQQFQVSQVLKRGGAKARAAKPCRPAEVSQTTTATLTINWEVCWGGPLLDGHHPWGTRLSSCAWLRWSRGAPRAVGSRQLVTATCSEYNFVCFTAVLMSGGLLLFYYIHCSPQVSLPFPDSSARGRGGGCVCVHAVG